MVEAVGEPDRKDRVPRGCGRPRSVACRVLRRRTDERCSDRRGADPRGAGERPRGLRDAGAALLGARLPGRLSGGPGPAGGGRGPARGADQGLPGAAPLRGALLVLHLAVPDHREPGARPAPARQARAVGRVGRRDRPRDRSARAGRGDGVGRSRSRDRAGTRSATWSPRASRRFRTRQREVLLLREVDGLSYEEIAETMQISKGTVMSRLHYARKKMIAVPRAARRRSRGRDLKQRVSSTRG